MGDQGLDTWLEVEVNNISVRYSWDARIAFLILTVWFNIIYVLYSCKAIRLFFKYQWLVLTTYPGFICNLIVSFYNKTYPNLSIIYRVFFMLIIKRKICYAMNFF